MSHDANADSRLQRRLCNERFNLVVEAATITDRAVFPLSHGVPRVDNRRVLSGIIFVIRNGLHWRDAPREYDPHKTLYNRFIRWSRLGVFDRILASLSVQSGVPENLMIDATHLKAHRTASSLLKKGMFPAILGAQKAPKK